MYSEWEEMNEKYKLTKLQIERTNTSKDAKETLNELNLYINAYVLTIIKNCKDIKNLTKEDVDDVYKSLREY